MQDILANYFDKVTKGLVSTLSTPDAYLNKMTLTLILIIFSLLIYFLLKKNNDGIILILQYLVDYERATSIKTALQRQILNEFDQNTNINFAVLDIRMLEK